MEFACLALIARRHFLVCPRTVRDGAFEQSTIFEVISEDRFEEIQIRNRFGIFQNALNYKQNAGSLSKKLPALERRRMLFGLIMVASWSI